MGERIPNMSMAAEVTICAVTANIMVFAMPNLGIR
jgi:hypothetical protein